MDNNKLNRIFAESECISNQMMTNYLDGRLSGKDKNLVEAHLETCELCKDEFEGLKSMKDKNRLSDIVFHLNQKISKRTRVKRKIFLFPHVSSMAAIILLLVGFAWLFFYIIHINPESLKQKQVAQSLEETNSKKEVQSNVDERSKSLDKISKDKDSVVVKKHITQTKDIELDDNLSRSKREQDNQIVGNIKEEKKKENEIVPEDRDIKTEKDEIKLENKKTITANEDIKLDDVEKENKVIKSPMNESDVASGESVVTKDRVKNDVRKKESALAKQKTVSTFDLAVQAFNNQDYKKAIDLFLKVKEDTKNKEDLYYYLAQSYQNINNQKKAIVYYNKILAIPKSKYSENALWNISQSQIKSGQNNEALQNLNLIKNNNGELKGRAEKQIDSLKNK